MCGFLTSSILIDEVNNYTGVIFRIACFDLNCPLFTCLDFWHRLSSIVTFQNPDCSGYDVQYTAHTSHLDDSSVLSTPIVLISSTVMPLNTPETFNSLMSNSGNDVKPAIEETSLL